SATKKGNGPAVPLTRCRGEGAGCGASVHRRLDRYEGASARRALEAHLAVDGREDRVVLAHAHIGAGVIGGAALAHAHVAGTDALAAEALHAQPLAGGIAAVAGAATGFLMGHDRVTPRIPLLRLPPSWRKPSSSSS